MVRLLDGEEAQLAAMRYSVRFPSARRVFGPDWSVPGDVRLVRADFAGASEA